MTAPAAVVDQPLRVEPVSRAEKPSRAAQGFDSGAAADLAVWASFAAGIAHVSTVQAHWRWWPLAGVAFAVIGTLQLLSGIGLLHDRMGPRLARPVVFATALLIVVYVVSRTRGLPGAPPVIGHGAPAGPGRPIVPGRLETVAATDLITLVAELIVVVALLAALPIRARRVPFNALAATGVALVAAATIGVL
jgi:hypothetical protein